MGRKIVINWVERGRAQLFLFGGAQILIYVRCDNRSSSPPPATDSFLIYFPPNAIGMRYVDAVRPKTGTVCIANAAHAAAGAREGKAVVATKILSVCSVAMSRGFKKKKKGKKKKYI